MRKPKEDEDDGGDGGDQELDNLLRTGLGMQRRKKTFVATLFSFWIYYVSCPGTDIGVALSPVNRYGACR